MRDPLSRADPTNPSVSNKEQNKSKQFPKKAYLNFSGRRELLPWLWHVWSGIQCVPGRRWHRPADTLDAVRPLPHSIRQLSAISNFSPLSPLPYFSPFLLVLYRFAADHGADACSRSRPNRPNTTSTPMKPPACLKLASAPGHIRPSMCDTFLDSDYISNQKSLMYASLPAI
jgi:hypothetical protein